MTSTRNTSRRWRRVLSVAAGGALVAATLPAGIASAQSADEPPYDRGTDEVCSPPYTSAFTDVSPLNTHFENILCMADYGLTEGLQGGTEYGPSLAVSRAQMASFIARFIEDATGEELPAGDANRFDDRGQFVAPHRDNINKLAEAGVVAGTGDGSTYSPQLAVSRQQMASFIRNAVSYIDDGEVTPPSEPPAWTGGPIFNDAPFVTAHDANINALAGVGIVQGNRAGNYLPVNLVTRDQMASFVMRAYDYVASDEFGQEPQPTTSVTLAPTTIVAGGSVTATFGGDVDAIDTVSVAGDCVEDGALTLTGSTATVAIDGDTPSGDCTLTFTVTYDDGSTQTLTADVTVVGIPAAAATGVYLDGTVEVCVIDAEGGTAEIWAAFDDQGRVSFSGDAAQDTVYVDGDELDLSDDDDRLAFEAACVGGTTIDADYDTDGASTFELYTQDANRVTNTTTGDNFPTITAAVAAADEDEILVARGDFDETVEIDTDGLTVRAADDADASLAGSFVVDAEQTTIDGFVLSGYDASVDDRAGVYLASGEGHTVSNNTFDTGLVLGEDDIAGAAPLTGISAPVGSDVEATVTGNTFVGHNLGVYANPSVDLTIDGNTFAGNVIAVGVDSTAGAITDNVFEGNERGTELFQDGVTPITGNSFDADHTEYVCQFAGYDLGALAADNTFAEGPITFGDCLVPSVDEGVTNVTQSTAFATIQEAVDAADVDDELLVAGDFAETVNVSTALTLTGAEGATLDGTIALEGVDGASVSGLTVTPGSYLGQTVAFYLADVSDVSITGNVVRGEANVGVGVVNATGGDTEEAWIGGNEFHDLQQGVFANPSAEFTIEDNRFEGNLAGSANDATSHIRDNVFVDNGEGIGLGAVAGDVTGNSFAGNDDHVCDYEGSADLAAMIADNDFDVAVEVVGDCIVDEED